MGEGRGLEHLRRRHSPLNGAARIVGKLLTFVVLILFSAIALAGAIAFGLGCKDMARQFLIELLKGDKKD
jgi:hypothetical protein